MHHSQTYVAKHAVMSNDFFVAELVYVADAYAKPGEQLRVSVALFDVATHKTYREATNDYQRDQCKAIMLIKGMLPEHFTALMDLFMPYQPLENLARGAETDPDVQRVLTTCQPAEPLPAAAPTAPVPEESIV